MKQKKKWKIVVCILGVLLVAAAVSAFFIPRYFYYDEYRQYLQAWETEEGKEFVPLQESEPDVPGMVLVTQNDDLKLYTNPETTEIAVYEKKTGHITYSNPVDRDEDALASGVNQQLLNSTINIVYYNSSRVRASMNNYDMSIQYGQFEIQSLENGIRYVYTMQDPDNSTGIIPLQISEERLQTLILDKLEEADARTVRNYFTLGDGKYTLNEAVLTSKIGMSRLNRFFEECGYTQEDYETDMEGMEGQENISFTIPLEYRLTDNGLEVSVPAGEIRESGGAAIARLWLLPMFGAAGIQAEGYIVVPDGSGALIEFNNGTRNAPYSQSIYGIDPVVQSYTVTDLTETARLPVFGLKNGDQAFLARITGGDALANINANVSGNTNSYNFAYTEFSLREIELLNMFGVSGNQADVPVVENDLYEENLSVTYSFLGGEDADYSGMAGEYRDQLVKEGVLKEHTESEGLPFYLDILGGVEIQKHVLGVPYDGVYTMTSCEQAGQILDLLYKAGIGNVQMNYIGWFNGGVYHDAADRIKPIRTVGTQQELEELSSRLEDNGGNLFLDTAFYRMPYTSDRFNPVLEASKYYSGYVVELGALNPATMRQTSTLNWYDELAYYIVSPRFLPWYVEHFREDVSDYDVSGISLRDMGDILASDKKRTEVINRQEAESVVMGQFDLIQSDGFKLMETGGNAYTFGYVTDIIDAPTEYSRFYIVDEQIPFYQMVIHGSICYTGKALNLMDADMDDELLLGWIEYGAAPHFTLSYEESGNIKYTSSSDMYSVCYSIWMEDVIRVYHQMEKALAPVQGAVMVRHERLDSGLVMVEYDNGVVIYINKTNKPIRSGGVTVEAMDYLVKGDAA